MQEDGLKKTILQKSNGLLECPDEETGTHRKTLRRRKNLAFSADTCLKNKQVWSKVISRKVWIKLKLREKVNWTDD